ncbi:MAG: hypothetical protein JWM10_1692 [Myxococcaceae bacterium]|nr:hypothetical protein [Myxococcaceae bacterium]
MTAKTTDKVLRAVTQRVMDSFTAQGALFTALDVSNAVKGTLPDIRHREVAPIVRDLYERGAMGDYRQDLIDVLADGHKPVQAYLYHLPEHDVDLYDDSMRNQLSIPPVSTSTDASGEGNLGSHSTEAPVLVGRDGRARIARQLLMNAGIVSEEIAAEGQASPGKLTLTTPTGSETASPTSAVLEYEHPSLLHVPRGLMAIFGANAKLVARVYPNRVEIVHAH